MPKKSYVQIDGILYEKGMEPGRDVRSYGPMVVGDQPDFISPIDGKLYSGRAGMRDHCARHDVVNNRDLVGLPTMTANSDFRSPEQKRASAEQRKQMIIQQVDKHYR